jgi:cytochrome c oxidase cbb3-type subunit 4
MDAGTIRAMVTLILFLSFVVLVVWAWSPAPRKRFEEAANLPFVDDDRHEASAGRGGRVHG